MSETPSSSRECNHCNKHVAVVTLGHLVICSECTNVFLPATDSSPLSLSQDLTVEEDFTMNLDLGEIFRTTEENTIEFDDEAYGALIQNLRERDDGVTRGAPTAVKSTIEKLESFEVCAVCKDVIVTGEIGKKLLCGHCYHENCIVTWLGTRSSCPLCKFYSF